MELQNTVINEIRQTRKDRYCMIPRMLLPRTGKFIEKERRTEVSRSGGKGEGKVLG